MTKQKLSPKAQKNAEDCKRKYDQLREMDLHLLDEAEEVVTTDSHSWIEGSL